MSTTSTISGSNFDGISFDGVNTNGGASISAARRTRRRHGDVQSGIETSNFNNISFDGVNTNGGGFNFGGAQGLGGEGAPARRRRPRRRAVGHRSQQFRQHPPLRRQHEWRRVQSRRRAGPRRSRRRPWRRAVGRLRQQLRQHQPRPRQHERRRFQLRRRSRRWRRPWRRAVGQFEPAISTASASPTSTRMAALSTSAALKARLAVTATAMASCSRASKPATSTTSTSPTSTRTAAGSTSAAPRASAATAEHGSHRHRQQQLQQYQLRSPQPEPRRFQLRRRPGGSLRSPPSLRRNDVPQKAGLCPAFFAFVHSETERFLKHAATLTQRRLTKVSPFPA